MTQPKPPMDRESAIQAAYQGHKSYTLMNTIAAYDAPSVLSYSLNVEKGGFVSGFQAGADYQAKQDAAEIERLNILLRLSDSIRLELKKYPEMAVAYVDEQNEYYYTPYAAKYRAALKEPNNG